MVLLLSFITDLYFSTSEIIAQIFNPAAELKMPIETPTKEAIAETETHPVTPEVKISKHSV